MNPPGTVPHPHRILDIPVMAAFPFLDRAFACPKSILCFKEEWKTRVICP